MEPIGAYGGVRERCRASRNFDMAWVGFDYRGGSQFTHSPNIRGPRTRCLIFGAVEGLKHLKTLKKTPNLSGDVRALWEKSGRVARNTASIALHKRPKGASLKSPESAEGGFKRITQVWTRLVDSEQWHRVATRKIIKRHRLRYAFITSYHSAQHRCPIASRATTQRKSRTTGGDHRSRNMEFFNFFSLLRSDDTGRGLRGPSSFTN
jgi:hypothetical protein